MPVYPGAQATDSTATSAKFRTWKQPNQPKESSRFRCTPWAANRHISNSAAGSPLSTLLEVSPGSGVMAGAHFVPCHCTKRAQTIIMVEEAGHLMRRQIQSAESPTPSKTVGSRTAQLMTAL